MAELKKSRQEERCEVLLGMTREAFMELISDRTRKQIEDDPCLSLVVRRRRHPKYR